ncbi:hypothetical protein B0H13DRAFT_2564722 [Mycena leptocephala]|nr:hypothetical protein B0H13DRAFT_2564722 [Mycena leptocephala]
MAPDAAKALQKVSLVGQHKSAVIVGGTLGIGAAIARHFAELGCSRIVIFGRNEARGAAVLEELRLLSPKATPAITLEFVKGDLCDSHSMRAAAGACRRRVEREGLIIWLCARKVCRPPPLKKTRMARRACPGAAVMSIADQGQSLDDLSVDDLSLTRRLATGISQTTMFLDQSKRDSSVLDAFHEELNIRYPKYRYFHLSPTSFLGLVSSEQLTSTSSLAISSTPSGLGKGLSAPHPISTRSAGLYPHRRVLTTDRYFDSKLNPTRIGKWAANPQNRKRCGQSWLRSLGK